MNGAFTFRFLCDKKYFWYNNSKDSILEKQEQKKVFQGVGISLYEAGRQIIYSIKNQYL